MNYEEANRLFRYDQSTGCLYWKVSPANNVKAETIAGCNDKNGYRVVRYNKINYYAHRIIWLIVYGEYPSNCIDHINRNASDNRLCNLRAVQHRENMLNKKKCVNNTSGAMGVSFDKSTNKWRARISLESSRLSIGSYLDWFDAVCARKAAEFKYNYSQGHGR